MTNPWNNYSWIPKDEPTEPANDELLSSVRTDQERSPVHLEVPGGDAAPSSSPDSGGGGFYALDPAIFGRNEP